MGEAVIPDRTKFLSFLKHKRNILTNLRARLWRENVDMLLIVISCQWVSKFSVLSPMTMTLFIFLVYPLFVRISRIESEESYERFV